MSTIRHICAGHEYRYDTETGEVRNNYGTVVSVVTFCKLTGAAALHRADVPTILIALLNSGDKTSPEFLAQFAIRETAVAIPEA